MDYAQDSAIIGFEWLGVDQGIDVSDMLVPDAVIAALEAHGFTVKGKPVCPVAP